MILGKGIGFGKKVTEYVEPRAEDTVYSMKECTERGEAEDIVNEVSPVCLEIADAVLNKAEEEFGNIDRRILFPLADHIEFAVKRIKNNEQIINPLTADIRVLFHSEYKVAEGIKPLLLEKMGDRFYKISDDIKRCVEFKKSNLLKDPYPTGCHLIVCRNVLIYFTEEAKKDVYEKFNKSLVTDGCLFVGNTEQIIGYRDMGYSYDHLFFYRKTN